MRGKRLIATVVLMGVMLAAIWSPGTAQGTDTDGPVVPQALAGSGFTYQGRLDRGGNPYSGTCDFRFSLYDALSEGSQVGSMQTIGPVDVTDGLFTVLVNSGDEFGAGAFTGEGRWLAIEVQCAGDGGYTSLDPRQELTPAPYALALPGLRTEPNAESPNVIGGFAGNSVAAGVRGATIGGGGSFFYPNQVLEDYATVGGGRSNTASGHSSTVGGGGGNSAVFGSATVGGGLGNTADGSAATVGGGEQNTASGDGYATVGGGFANSASGWIATVPGGESNLAAGSYSFAAGRYAKALHQGSFVWADSATAYFSSTGDNQFLVRAEGGIKLAVGTSTFTGCAAALQVETTADSGEAAWLRQTSTSNTDPVLKLVKHPASSANFLVGMDREGDSPATRKFHIDNNGTYHAGSDFAEALPAVGDQGDYHPGDVLVISSQQPGSVERCSQPYDGAVIGVYSTRPGFLGADKDGATEVWPGDIPVAVLGIVPVKVSAENGPIRPGDLLTTSSTPGHAMRCEGLELCFGRTLGKALEGLDRGTGVIKMLVTLQ